MRVRLVRRPGQHGTREYLEEYGDRLVCVRYRYDAAAGRRYKTIEIIVGEAPWAPPGSETRGADPSALGGEGPAIPRSVTTTHPLERNPSPGSHPFTPATLVGLRLPRDRPGLIALVERAGGAQRPLLGVWAISYDKAVAHGFAEFIIDSVERLAETWNSQYGRRSSRG